MELEALISRHSRLQRELAVAYEQLPWHCQRIDELAVEMLQLEMEIMRLQRSGQPASRVLVRAGAEG